MIGEACIFAREGWLKIKNHYVTGLRHFSRKVVEKKGLAKREVEKRLWLHAPRG